MNRITKEWWNGVAESAQEACEKAGWRVGDCWIRVRTPIRSDPNNPTGSGYSGGGWANVKDQ